MQFSNQVLTLANKAEKALAPIFSDIDAVSFENTQKIMNAFRENRVSEAGGEGGEARE